MAEGERWLWLGASVLLAVGATQMGWWLWSRRENRAWIARLIRSAFFPALLQVARLLYYVGFPFAALIWGQDAVVERLLGLKPLAALSAGPVSPSDLAANWAVWAQDVGWAMVLGLGAWATLAAGWWTVHRAGGGSAGGEIPLSPWTLLREAVFHEVHWAFYRNAPTVVLGAYWGAWAGLVLTTLEAALNPWWRAALEEKGRASATLVRAGLAVLSVVFYLQTMNLWLAVLLHWGVTWGLAAWIRAFPERQAPLGESSPS